MRVSQADGGPEGSSQSIRPMPRASEQAAQIIERLEEVRTNIYNLSEELKQVRQAHVLRTLSNH